LQVRAKIGKITASDSSGWMISMLNAIALLLICQLAGETLAHFLALPLPGPVIGMVLLLVALMLRAPLPEATAETADGILKHLSMLFVPAGVGVVQQLDLLGAEGGRLLGVIVLSTIFALAITAITFAAIARLMGADDEHEHKEASE
jgi:holin-like protein